MIKLTSAVCFAEFHV